ncbi:hypothetical protein A3A70_03035 [candidate division WWE3 bacterium RIFCSPLOWO2_01_FULL_42_11]|uniref:Uncharacterized protein n=2 Tax=Bacteria candidate phyla TaxID=1783234 RepID=A0A1F4VRS4_UNCKA|nr:MAG: hypothetical protein A3A70_03035 [candidate division WWE3 bacterium RIFCSPLOWO2_01_FULL_42_11]OGG15301.1 MAG: hypothetical protein A2773_03130 [Candidatus Gottesmanbacteria bacterium RIFCSPHIGHO2_01_FULL_39_10]
MNVANRLNNLGKSIDLLEGKGKGYYLIIFKDEDKFYYYQKVDEKRVKIYPTKEELDDYRNSHKELIITIASCLDMTYVWNQ